MIAWVATHALEAAALALLWFGLGRLATARLEIPPAYATGLGYGLLGQLMFVLAALGVLTARVLAVALILCFLTSCWFIREIRAPSWLIVAGALPAFVLALYPPSGWDATAYHLPYARLFAEAGSLVFAGTLRFPVFPQLAEMHFTGALLLADDALAQLTQWITLLVTAVAASGIAAELGGVRARPLAAALWLGTPLAIYTGANAYVDCALTMSVTLAFGAWLVWRRTAHPGWIALAGAFAGMAAATKYHGLYFLLALFIAVACVSLRASALFAVPATLFAAPWYARIAAETGNPIFPFFGRIFGRNEWRPLIERHTEVFLGIPGDPFLSILHRAFLDRIARGMPPHSPWVFLFLPMAVAAAAVEPRLRVPLGISAIWTLLVWPLDWRFLLPVLPLACVAIALILERLVPRRTTAVAAVLLLPGFAWGSILIAKFGAIPHSAAQRETFIARKIPVYRALQFARGSTAYVLDASNSAYYCRGRCLGESIGPYRYELVDPLLDHPDQLAATLRRFGARYLIAERSRGLNLPFHRVYSDDKAEVFEVPALVVR